MGGTSSLAVLAATAAFHATHAVLPTVLAALAVELTTFSIARTIIGYIKGKRRQQLEQLRVHLEVGRARLDRLGDANALTRAELRRQRDAR